jgi:hypothetical protein
MKLKTLLLPSIVLGGAALLVGPAPTGDGYSLIGGSLGTSQRDVRVFNNFTDSTANDNQVPDTQFPGFQGANMALWKGVVEWGSGLHGNGNGDPTQPGGLGSGGANFDANWQGTATSIGSANNNIHSEISGSSGGVLAYTETPISDGWRIRYYSTWQWQDGPGSPFGLQVDLQGVGCHEYGHALGLGHSASTSATMYPSIAGSGAGERSIASDDINGIKAVYGTKSATKPTITNAVLVGSTLTISGTQFSTSGNEVWFTNKNSTSSSVDPTVKVASLSSTGGGTQITVTIPTNAGPGDVMVKKNASGGSSLSNAWPIDVTGGGGGGPLTITSISPSTISALNVGTDQIVTINGSGFTPTTLVSVNGVLLGGIPSSYTYVSSAKITFDPPDAPYLGPVLVSVSDGPDLASTLITYAVNPTPALQAGNGDEPITFLTLGGLDVVCAADPGDVFVLLASTSSVPSVLPGWFSLAIGNNFASIFFIVQPTIGAAGLASLHLPTALPPLTTFYMQGLAIDPFLTLPLQASNVQECMSLF